MFVHEPPGPLSPQEPLVQVALGAQLMLAPQLTLHAPAPPQVYGKQLPDAGVAQWPDPSHVDCGVGVVVPGGHVASLQMVPEAYFWQAPPAQRPFVPQLGAS